jgi:hypothetical protein
MVIVLLVGTAAIGDALVVTLYSPSSTQSSSTVAMLNIGSMMNGIFCSGAV